MASLFSSVLKAKIEEMGFMTDTLIMHPNDNMTSYIKHTYTAYLRYTVYIQGGAKVGLQL